MDVAALVVGITGLLGALVAAHASYQRAKSDQRRDVVTLLREEVDRVHKRLEECEKENAALREATRPR